MDRQGKVCDVFSDAPLTPVPTASSTTDHAKIQVSWGEPRDGAEAAAIEVRYRTKHPAVMPGHLTPSTRYRRDR